MLKQIIFIFLFFAINISIAQNFTATQKIPDSVKAGSSFVVTTTINRGHVIDFMEFFQQLPIGFTATDIDSKGGDFEFDNNEVKIIWLSSSVEEIYTMSYLIRVPPNVSGLQTISGKIIYITNNNEHKIFALPAKKIKLINPKTLAQTKTQKTVPEIPTYTTSIETEEVTENIKQPATRAENNATLAQLKASLDSGQVEINRLKSELEKTTASQKNILKTLSSNNTASDAKTDVLLAQLKMKSDFNQAEIIRLKAELEKAKLVAANTLRAINSKNTASNAEIEYMLAEIKMKSDSGQLEINRLKKELEKIKAPSINASTPLNSAGGIVHISESDYFLDINGIPVSNGFYVVIGTFGNRENADRFRASNMIKGHLNTKIIRNQFTKVYNIFVLKTNNRADADAERMKYKAEYPDVWILKLE